MASPSLAVSTDPIGVDAPSMVTVGSATGAFCHGRGLGEATVGRPGYSRWSQTVEVPWVKARHMATGPIVAAKTPMYAPASSVKTSHLSRNRGVNRQPKSALFHIIITRILHLRAIRAA